MLQQFQRTWHPSARIRPQIRDVARRIQQQVSIAKPQDIRRCMYPSQNIDLITSSDLCAAGDPERETPASRAGGCGDLQTEIDGLRSSRSTPASEELWR